MCRFLGGFGIMYGGHVTSYSEWTTVYKLLGEDVDDIWQPVLGHHFALVFLLLGH